MSQTESNSLMTQRQARELLNALSMELNRMVEKHFNGPDDFCVTLVIRGKDPSIGSLCISDEDDTDNAIAVIHKLQRKQMPGNHIDGRRVQ